MGGDEEGDEVRVVLVDVPADEPGEDHAVPETRDGEQLGDALEQTQDDRLEVGDHARFGFDPDWNQAKASTARPTRKAAIPCFV